MASKFEHPKKPIMFSMIVTPMEKDGKLDERGIREHLRRQVAAGVGVYLGSGGSGEGHALTHEERFRLYQIGVEECQGKVPVYCNPPEARSAEEMLVTVRLAVEAGIDCVQLYQMDAGHGRIPVVAEQEGYFRDLLEATDHPVVLSIHQAVGYLAPVNLTIRLCNDYPQIKAVNLPFGPSNGYFMTLQDGVRNDVKIYGGMANIFTLLPLGAWGALVAEPNHVPNLSQAVLDYYMAGDIKKAAETYANILRIGEIIDMGRRVSADGPKGAMKALGYDVGPPRKPRIPVDDATIEKMRKAFEALNVHELEREAAARKR